MCSIQYSRIDSLAVDENCSGVQNFCPFVQKREAKLDPITDIFRTMHVTAFGLHRLEATAPWGVEQEKQTEEKVTPSDKKMSPTDSAHFAMLSRGNCWLSVEGILSFGHRPAQHRASYATRGIARCLLFYLSSETHPGRSMRRPKMAGSLPRSSH